MPFSYSLLLIIVSVFRVSVFVSVSYPLMLRFYGAPFFGTALQVGDAWVFGWKRRMLGYDL